MVEIIPNFHPAIVHFPIAFATAAVVFITTGTVFRSWSHATQCLMTGRWMLWSTALFALIAATFGWFAFNSVTHDEVSHAAMTLHRNWALGTLTALLVLTAWDVWRGHSGKLPSYGFLGLLVTAWLLVMSTAWLGAELVYRHGIGVMALPKAEGPSHSHASHNHEHSSTVEPSRNAEPDQEALTTDRAATTNKNGGGHTHAPGMPPH